MPVRNILGDTIAKQLSKFNRIVDDHTIKHANAISDQHKHAVSIRDRDEDAVRDGNAIVDQQPDGDPERLKHAFAIANTDAVGVANADPDTLGRYHLRVDVHGQQCWRRQSVQSGCCEWPRRRVLSDAHGNNLNSSEHLL